jgi:spoIIIJ-associated protein
MSNDDLVASARQATTDLLKAMGFDAKVEARADGNRVDVTVDVDRDDDLLHGRQGETLQAIQHLLNRFVNRGDGSRYHLQLEVNGFWSRRENELAELARNLAEEAVRTNAEVTTDFLNSNERRIVHSTLKEDGRVRTFSLGDGAVKRVTIAPAGHEGPAAN